MGLFSLTGTRFNASLPWSATLLLFGLASADGDGMPKGQCRAWFGSAGDHGKSPSSRRMDGRTNQLRKLEDVAMQTW